MESTTVLAEAAAPPAASATPAESAAPPAAGSAAAPPAASGASANDGNLRQLRQQYETTRTQLERFSGLGDFDQVQTAVAAHQRIAQEAMTLGERLGYSAEQLREALATDALDTLAFLRQEAAKLPAEGKELAETIRREVAQATQPFSEHLNHQLTQAAEARFDGEFDRLVKEAFPTELHSDLRQLLYDATGELMKYDQQALLRVKRGESVADVKRHFDDARGRILKAFTAWSEAEGKRTGAAPGGAARAPAAKPGPTLDEIIEDPSLVGARYK